MTAVSLPPFRKDHHRSRSRIDHDLHIRGKEVQKSPGFPKGIEDDRRDKDDPAGKGLPFDGLPGLSSAILHPRRRQLSPKLQEIVQGRQGTDPLSTGPMHLKRAQRLLLISLCQQPQVFPVMVHEHLNHA